MITTHHGQTKDCPAPLPNGACPGHAEREARPLAPPQITQVGRETAREIVRVVESAARSALSRYGLALDPARCTYDPMGGTVKVTLTVKTTVTADGTDADRLRFDTLAGLHGLQGAYGRTFRSGPSSNPSDYTVVAFGPRARTVICRRSDGRLFRFQPAGLLRLLDGQAGAL